MLAGYCEPDEGGERTPELLYGSVKMWAHLRREVIDVARCTVERLMCANGWRRVSRRKKARTTTRLRRGLRIWSHASSRAVPELAPNVLVVADFIHVPLADGSYAYTAFVIDALAGRPVTVFIHA